MHIKSFQNKLSGFELWPFGPPTSMMSEKMFIEWREDGTMLEIMIPSLVSWKRCVGSPSLLLEIFTYIYIYSLCYCSCKRWGTHKQLEVSFQAFPISCFHSFSFKLFVLCLLLSFCRVSREAKAKKITLSMFRMFQGVAKCKKNALNLQFLSLAFLQRSKFKLSLSWNSWSSCSRAP